MAKSNLPLDFHTHILPGVDDGSRDAAESLALLREEARQGVATVALTPHFYADSDFPRRFLDRRARALDVLLDAARAADDTLPELLLGAEVHYFEGISYCEEIIPLALEGTRLLLLEPPHGAWSPRMLEEFGAIHDRLGLLPVIAHLDRYLPLQRDASLLDALMRLDVLIQVNTEAFLSRRTSRWALRALAAGNLDFLGSDCHNLRARLPNFEAALHVIERERLTPALTLLFARSAELTEDARRCAASP